MIRIVINENGIRMEGHACRHGPDGIDRVCAAVSALTCNLVNSLRDLTRDEVAADIESGRTVICWERLSDGGKLLVDAWFLGLTDINREYNCIEFSN